MALEPEAPPGATRDWSRTTSAADECRAVWRKYGPDWRVVVPAVLRERVAKRARETAAIYAA